jgi:hypothetical protein
MDNQPVLIDPEIEEAARLQEEQRIQSAPPWRERKKLKRGADVMFDNPPQLPSERKPGGMMQELKEAGLIESSHKSPSSHSPEKKRLKYYKHAWREQVMRDPALKYQPHSVAYWLADWMDWSDTERHYRETGEIVIFMGQGRIAKLLGCDPGEVSRAIDRICSRWHLVKVRRGLSQPRGGKPPTNEYLVLIRRHWYQRQYSALKVKNAERARREEGGQS